MVSSSGNGKLDYRTDSSAEVIHNKKADGIYLRTESKGKSIAAVASAYTAKKIDFTAYSVLYVELKDVTISGEGGMNTNLYNIVPAGNLVSDGRTLLKRSNESGTTIEIISDLSKISGAYWLSIHIWMNGMNLVSKGTITKVWVEK